MPDALVTHLIQIGVAALMLWVVKTVQDVTVELKSFRVTLFGDNGRNGLNGTVKELQGTVTRNESQINDLRVTVAVLKDHREP